MRITGAAVRIVLALGLARILVGGVEARHVPDDDDEAGCKRCTYTIVPGGQNGYKCTEKVPGEKSYFGCIEDRPPHPDGCWWEKKSGECIPVLE